MSHHKDQENSLQIGGCSFLVRIQFRQNSTWQGTIQWFDEKKTRSFRSVLEMIMLINEAIDSSSGAVPKLQLWTEREEVS